jgi:hypothetical protein
MMYPSSTLENVKAIIQGKQEWQQVVLKGYQDPEMLLQACLDYFRNFASVNWHNDRFRGFWSVHVQFRGETFMRQRHHFKDINQEMDLEGAPVTDNSWFAVVAVSVRGVMGEGVGWRIFGGRFFC